MKKLFLAVLFAASAAFSAAAQDEAESYASLAVIPKLEGQFLSEESGAVSKSFGNSGLYTKFEGTLSEHFSWLLVNEWFAAPADGDWGWLYKSTGRSDSNNWLNYCLVNFTFNSWTFTVGKDMIQTGGFVNDDWDWDVHYPFTNSLWNNLVAYQWGGKIAWTTPSGNTNLCVQMTSSPWGEKPFASGLWSYSACWRGEYGWFSNIWSWSAIQRADKGFDHIFALGQRATFDKWTITLDYSNMLDSFVTVYDEENDEEYDTGFALGYSFIGTVCYAPSDKIDFSIKGLKAKDHWFAGAQIQYRPFENTDLLRIHGCAGYDSLFGGFVANAGLTCNFDFKLW